MAIPYIQKAFYWLTYEQFPPGNWSYITDIPDAELTKDPWYGPMTLPAWFPRRAFITRCLVSTLVPISNGLQNEIGVWVDPKGIGYNTGQPPGAENMSDFTRDISLMHLFWNTVNDGQSQPISKDVILTTPVLLDRDASDKLVVQIACSQHLQFIAVEIGYLAVNSKGP